MTPAAASLLALLAAIVISFTSRVNVGLIAIPLSWAVGLYAGLGVDGVLAGFPTPLFVTLAGVTLLFALAEENGTVAVFARRLVGIARGSAQLVPLVLFIAAGAISTVGPGAIASVALVAPLGMAMGVRAGVPPFLIALVVANGANAGNLSPLSAVGVIANSRMAAAGLGGHEWKVWAANFLAHLVVTAAAYVALRRRLRTSGIAADPGDGAALTRAQLLTTLTIALWITAVVYFRASIALAALSAAAAIIVMRAAEESAAIVRMPWTAILMVCGVAMLVAAAERAGGMQLFTVLLSKLATPSTINGVIAFVTGVISTCSSTSGVVLPTFLPMAPGLVQQVGGGDPVAVALSINVGSSIVDVSPLSTLGALCVAAVANPTAARHLFRALLLWGLSMTVVGALLCQAFAGAMARL